MLEYQVIWRCLQVPISLLLRIYPSETSVLKTIQILFIGTTVALLNACGEKVQQTSVAQSITLPAPSASAVTSNLDNASPSKIFVKDFADVAINKNEYQNKEIAFYCPMVMEAMGSFFCVPRYEGGIRVVRDEKTIDPETNAIFIRNCTKTGNKCHGYVEGTLNANDGRLTIIDAKISKNIPFFF